MHLHMYDCVCVSTWACEYLLRPEEGIRIPGAGFTGHCWHPWIPGWYSEGVSSTFNQ